MFSPTSDAVENQKKDIKKQQMKLRATVTETSQTVNINVAHSRAILVPSFIYDMMVFFWFFCRFQNPFFIFLIFLFSLIFRIMQFLL